MRFGRADAGIGTPGTVLALYVGWMVALSGAYLIGWPGSSLLVAAIGVSAAGAVLVGVRRYRPDRWRWWLVLAAAPLLDTSARIVYSLLPGPVGTLKPGVWVVWLLHLVMLAALVTGILGLARSALRAVSTVIDIAIIMLGAGLLFGILIAIPYAGEPGIGALWATVRVAYVARDVVMLALLAYIGLAGGRGPSSILVQAGLLGFVVSDVLFRLGRIRGEWLLATPIDAGWLLFAAAVGAAALVPSMVDFAGQGEPGARLPVAERPSAQLRLGLVMVVALVPSIGLVVGLFEPPGWYSKALVFTATAMLLLAFARIVDVTTQLRDKVRGERVIRDAVAALADAQDPPSVTAVIRRAIESLVRPGSVHGVTLSSLSAARRGPGLPPDGQAWTVAIPVGGDVRSPTAGAAARQEEPSLLFVRGNRRALERARSWLSILATQAGVALDRIRLNDDLIRHMREAYFRTLVQKSTDVILIVDDDNRIRFATPSAASLVGARSVVGASLLAMIGPADRADAARLLDRARSGPPDMLMPASRTGDGTHHGDWIVHRDDGSPVHVEVVCRDLRSDESIAGLVLTLRDVTEQRRLESELAERAVRDPLTGLSNRLPFIETLAVVERREPDPDRICAVYYIDVDDLKFINDGLGHEAGDAVLTAVAARLHGVVERRPKSADDAVCRLGGDEFAMLLTDLPDLAAVEAVAQGLTEDLARPITLPEQEVTCTASVGVATTLDPGPSQGLLRDADLALYAAKGEGKWQWRRFEPQMRTSLTARLAMRGALANALDNNEFFLEYQPIVSLRDQRTVGFEALLRWDHPIRGRLNPDQFIEVAEESGLITPIGAWVTATALSAARRWSARAAGAAPYVAVNVSARQFHSRGFVDMLRRLLDESGVAPGQVLVEITESLLLRKDTRVWQDLETLRRSGVKIAIDDFGTGYSALSYLRDVPLDVVKLDRSFVAAMDRSTRQRALVRGIAGLARTLDLRVVAEGIETAREQVAAADAGCDFGQGFRFSPPLPDAEVLDWIAACAGRAG